MPTARRGYAWVWATNAASNPQWMNGGWSLASWIGFGLPIAAHPAHQP
jgi:hypothetical protein